MPFGKSLGLQLPKHQRKVYSHRQNLQGTFFNLCYTFCIDCTHAEVNSSSIKGFVDYSAAEDLESASCDQQQHVTFEQQLAAANSERDDFFQQNMIGKAVGKYLKVERLLKLS